MHIPDVDNMADSHTVCVNKLCQSINQSVNQFMFSNCFMLVMVMEPGNCGRKAGNPLGKAGESTRIGNWDANSSQCTMHTHLHLRQFIVANPPGSFFGK